MKTYMPDKDSVPRKWYLVDIKGKTLGRVATAIAAVLRGKHKPTYTPSIDTGDFVVVINSGKFQLQGRNLRIRCIIIIRIIPAGSAPWRSANSSRQSPRPR